MDEKRIKLHSILTDRFSESELRTLCFDLGIDYDNLPGEGKSDKARELIAYHERRDSTSQLVEIVTRMRPDIPWSEVAEMKQGIISLEKGIYSMDPQTISAIATETISIISSYLAQAGKATASGIGEDIYQVVKTHFGKKPTTQESLDDLEKSPTDADLQAALRVQLRKLLEQDKTFGVQLQSLLQETGKTESGYTTIKQIAGDNAKQFGQVFGNVTFGED